MRPSFLVYNGPFRLDLRFALRLEKKKFAGEVGLVSEAAEIARVVEMMKKKYWMSRIYLWFRGWS
jgi:hypothetical protein